MDLGSEYKVDRPVDPRGGSTSSPELICGRQRQYCTPYKVQDHSRDKAGQGSLRVVQPPNPAE